MAEEKAPIRERETKKKPKPAPRAIAEKKSEAVLESKESALPPIVVPTPPVIESAKEPVAVASANPQPIAPRVSSPSSVTTAPSVSGKVAPFKTGDDYTVLVHYDKHTRLFVGEVAEFPRLSASGISREEVIRDLNIKLEDYIEDIRHQVAHLPEPIYSRQYPEKIEISLSQSLFRKLDLLSRQEKVALEKLISELLASSIERRFGGSPGEKRFQPQQPLSNQGGERQPQAPSHNRHGGGNRHGGRGRHQPGGVDSRENFLEYVRSLEKGGGNWRKK